jgi:predicted nuclease with TOPRIM domain
MGNDEMITQPTINTLLAHLVELRTGQAELRQTVEELVKGQEELRTGQTELQQTVEELRKGHEELRKGQEGLRADLNSGLRRVERKIEILNDNLLTIKADIRDSEVRIEKLESESLARS